MGDDVVGGGGLVELGPRLIIEICCTPTLTFMRALFIVYCLQRQHVSAITVENWISFHFAAEKLSRQLDAEV